MNSIIDTVLYYCSLWHMPRKGYGGYGVIGFGDERYDAPLPGVYSTQHGIQRARERGIPLEALRKSALSAAAEKNKDLQIINFKMNTDLNDSCY